MRAENAFFRSTILLGIAIGVLSIGASSFATAQDRPPSIGIVDVQKILRDSQASKSLRPQIEKRRKDYQTSVRKREIDDFVK